MNINKRIQEASHSGAQLKVIKSGSSFLVQKQMLTNIERNNLAIQKQIAFKNIHTTSYEIIAIPITSVKKVPESLTIEMPYIEGIGGDSIAPHGTRVISNNLKVALNTYLIDALARSTIKTISKNKILDKLSDIEKSCSGKFDLFPDLNSLINLVKKLCVKDLLIPLGPCHGDLTLSNMKITNNHKLYLFDFLDSFIESPLQDAAKLMQDLEHGWSFRKEKPSIRLKGAIFCENSYPDFITTIKKFHGYELNLLEILTILRIVPYINISDDCTIEWLNRVSLKILNCLEG